MNTGKDKCRMIYCMYIIPGLITKNYWQISLHVNSRIFRSPQYCGDWHFMDFEDTGNSIMITFPFTKNDQFHRGNSSCLVLNGTDIDPFKIVRKYFWLCGFCLRKKNGDTSRPNTIMWRLKGRWKADVHEESVTPQVPTTCRP